MGLGRHSSDKKKRDPMITYRHKIEAITKWYNRLITFREKNPVIINPNTKQETKRKPLKSLEEYIKQIKKPNEEK